MQELPVYPSLPVLSVVHRDARAETRKQRQPLHATALPRHAVHDIETVDRVTSSPYIAHYAEDPGMRKCHRGCT